MKNEQDVDALGKNRDKASEEQDFAKKQSQQKPATDNLDMEPFSVSKTEKEKEDQTKTAAEAASYAEEEHDKASQWEDHSAAEEPQKPEN